jgi:hypothetical protein
MEKIVAELLKMILSDWALALILPHPSLSRKKMEHGDYALTTWN